MTGLVATGSTTPITIENDGWFPDVPLADMRAAERVGGAVSDERLTQAVIAAIVAVNAELAGWQQTHIDNGIAKLEDVTAKTINDQSTLVQLYFRAVYSLAHADLIERFADYDTTNSGSKRAQEVLDSVADQHRNARWAVRDILGRTRTTAELI
jgi:hypothetical protein